ncbi:hypothetical protein CEN45_16200 [Fischerella thermalis CCMEE 5198]|jgi:hypothetical protein|uniref:hypothetical protein n=1 Tax=Fischerella thermalis TaxID=372787 RepID=UPI000C80DAF9|nr:hypothetical protein [Fischerella thermalis]PMB20822.1 hypothetical protein CEN45_16200 [Fischerella thermalis CCMEE 5198]
MSQDNQNSQPPSSPQPQDDTSGQRNHQRGQSFWKTKTIQILKGAIAVLETTVDKLETESPPPGDVSLNWWSRFLAKIRSYLPANFSAKLSDTALTGAIAIFAVILVWATSTIFPGKPTEIATTPPTSPTPLTSPSPEPSLTEEPTVAETPSPEEEPTPIPEPGPEVTPTPTPTIDNQPATIVLTPEQILIATIENQVAEVSDRFASGLIKSIQANFLTSNLDIKISDDWYTLSESEQNKLAAEILQRSQELDFTHLEISDSQNRLVARNPVVGSEMVIFRRQA